MIHPFGPVCALEDSTTGNEAIPLDPGRDGRTGRSLRGLLRPPAREPTRLTWFEEREYGSAAEMACQAQPTLAESAATAGVRAA